MKHFLIFAAAALLGTACGPTDSAQAGHFLMRSRAAAYSQADGTPWHGNYYDAAWGAPVALVVPPTAENQAHLGSGVGATRVTRIQHQFGPGYPMQGERGGPFYPTPAWPNSTDQFGDYYIRGPW